MMWTECATATVMTMIGRPELAGLKTVPSQPAKPTVVLMTNMSTTTIATVPNTERRRTAAARTMIRKTIGARVSRSSLVASAKARSRGTLPVR